MRTTTIISSFSDIRTWIFNQNPGGVYGDDELMAELAEAIHEADARPLYGADWSEWLDANAERLAREVVTGEVCE
jgi:hypothetical protein